MTPETSTTVRDIITKAVERHRDSLLQLSHSIGTHPELAFEEFHAAAEVADVLERAGFAVERGAYGLPTALESVYGNGDCTVALVAEYDALPGIGHACGHNVIAGAAVGAALALKDVAETLNLRVKLLGTPAEEAGGGKILMLEQGAWDDADFSLMVHGFTGPQIPCASFTTQAYEHITVTFTGRAAHAAAAPHEGVNAGDAATLAQVALGLLRQQLKTSVVVASFVECGGAATNIIPGQSTIQVEIRAFDEDDWFDASTRVRACIEGAAMASGCQVRIERTEEPYAPMRQHPDLARYWDGNIEELGYRIEVPAASGGGGSTDMGNVSLFLPSIHPSLSFRNCDAVPHTLEFAEAAVSPAGDRAVIDGALALALTVADVAIDQELRAGLRELRAERAANAVGAELIGTAAEA
ncbi:amidohydrolase [Arthrobacter cavernae]|uniref:Peptidase M20 domain-containing protein 2 n=1 Tax=Arthrobacter cavernae TaxID=2817681 RepID=A0A939KK26_9MICC|nr:amidohydrolase [Arthrobacter cavernae]MBO1268334.1 amidohydrolase [Arthrobacter cavernae]